MIALYAFQEFDSLNVKQIECLTVNIRPATTENCVLLALEKKKISLANG